MPYAAAAAAAAAGNSLTMPAQVRVTNGMRDCVEKLANDTK